MDSTGTTTIGADAPSAKQPTLNLNENVVPQRQVTINYWIDGDDGVELADEIVRAMLLKFLDTLVRLRMIRSFDVSD